MFIPALLQSLREGTPGRGFNRLTVKQAGLALPDPTKRSPDIWKASCVITGHLVAVLRGQEEFRTADHSAYLQEGRAEVRKKSVLWVEEALEETLAGAPVQYTCCLRQTTKTGEWMKVQPSMVNVMELGAQECRDALFL